MTRKDYERVAYGLAMAEPVRPQDAVEQWQATCKSVAHQLSLENPRFDKTKFLSACNFDYWKDRRPPR